MTSREALQEQAAGCELSTKNDINGCGRTGVMDGAVGRSCRTELSDGAVALLVSTGSG